MIKLFVLSGNCQVMRCRCMLESISIDVECKEGGVAWGRCVGRGVLQVLFESLADIYRAQQCRHCFLLFYLVSLICNGPNATQIFH